ncbi:MAG: pseudouridine synthase [Gammaproteobacteria bacterium]|nr:pseudouridine synthase [Gammaproteobacteria bacterium]
MPMILLNKPFRVLSQFSDAEGRTTLGDFVDVPGVYPAGRLDFDSEGLILLTDDGELQARISQPRSRLTKTYWAQVEGEPEDEQLESLIRGVTLKDGQARAVSARRIEEPANLWQREPPIRYRARIPTGWMEISLTEGRNRQVRRMTAAVGLPTLRLIRCSVGPFALQGLAPGESRVLSNQKAWALIAAGSRTNTR